MKSNAKKCKGIGKAFGFLGCGKTSLFRKYGLCPSCLSDWISTTDKGKAYIQSLKITSNKKVLSNKKKERRKEKEANKSIQKLIAEARKPFQKWIRYRDANRGCVSCGTVTSEIYHAGHFYKAELYTGMIFDERNVHKQCHKCNTFLDGNENMYRQALLKRFGTEWLQKLDLDASRNRKHSYSKEDVKNIKKEYLKRLRELK